MLKYLPPLLFCLIHLTLVVTFSLATYSEHVTYFVPYISDSGAFPPESCIFGQALNIMAALMCFLMYVRYLQIKEIFAKHNFSSKNYKTNKVAFIIGLMACLGCSLVANFQETAMLLVHWIGAIMVFVSGAVYQCFQSFIYFKIYPVFGSKTKNIIRAILATISSISALSFVIGGLIAGSQFKGNDVTKWSKEDGGFEIHVISTTSEWICASCTMTYLLFFMFDFKKITLSEPELFVNDNIAAQILVEVFFLSLLMYTTSYFVKQFWGFKNQTKTVVSLNNLYSFVIFDCNKINKTTESNGTNV